MIVVTSKRRHRPTGPGSAAITSRPGLWLAGAAVAIRVVAAALLIFGPWTNEPTELGGWDIERFVTITGEPGRPWRDHPVEYPPGSVVIFEALTVGQGGDSAFSTANGDAGGTSGDDPDDTIVGAHRVLVGLALAADLGLAWMLRRRSRRAALGYLLLGLPLVPMGLLRLDIIVALPATAAALIALRPRPEPRPAIDTTNQPPRQATSWATVLAAVLAAVAVLVKVWPGLLVPALWGMRRDRTALATILAALAGAATWLLWADSGLDPIRQVVELRGANGWHVESWGGVVTSLVDASGWRDLDPLDPGSAVTFELNAYRIGTMSPTLVTAGRIVAVAAAVALAWRARRLTTAVEPAAPVEPGSEPLARLGAVMLGSVGILLATAPLLSPQFLLWLTPWAALMLAAPNRTIPTPVVITAVAAVITGATLAVFGPPRLAEPVPALALAVRNTLLLVLPLSCWRWLGSTARSVGC